MINVGVSQKLSQFSELSGIVSFHQSENSGFYYQESLVPFFLMLMSIKAGHPDQHSISLYAPDRNIRLPSSFANYGRTAESQHQHNSFEFTYVLEGGMYQIVEGRRYYYPTGSCCLMNRNTLHTEETSTDFTCVFLSVTTDYIVRILEQRSQLLFSKEQEAFSSMIFDFFKHNLDESAVDTKDFLDFVPKITNDEQIQLAHQIFEDFFHTMLAPGYSATYRITALFLQLIEMLGNSDYYNAEHVTAKSNMDALLFARLDRILNERHGRITHSELADLLNYNGSYLGRIVKKYTGKSLFDYSMKFTMAYAATELVRTKKTAAEIAAELQFTNLTHFYKLFKKHHGMTPKEYRRQAALNE